MNDKQKIEKYEKVLSALFAERSGHYFICGEGGEKDKMGLPDTIFVCPTYGLDGHAIYKKEHEYDAPGY